MQHDHCHFRLRLTRVSDSGRIWRALHNIAVTIAATVAIVGLFSAVWIMTP